MTKKIFAMFLAVLMVVSLLPTSVFAAETTCPEVHTVDNCTYDVKGTVAPTCKDAGYTVYQCTACGDTFVGNFNYEYAEHQFEKADTIQPTCSDTGLKDFFECKVCGKKEGGEVIPALGEGISCLYGEWDNTQFDCTKDFKATRTCVICGEGKEVVEFKAPNAKHVWGDWTKGEGNVITRKCTATHIDNDTGTTWKCSATETSTAAPRHECVKVNVPEVAAKCEKTGTEAYSYCRECGQLFNTKGEKIDAPVVIPSLHDQLKAELDCMTSTKECLSCHQYVFVGSAGHVFTPWVVTTEPSCVNAGLRERTCSVCLNAKETEVMNPVGHVLYTQTVQATCATNKYTFTYCVRPGCNLKVETTATKDKVAYDLTVGENVLKAPVLNLEFYLNLKQAKLNKTLFLAGVGEHKLATAEDKGLTAKLVKAYKDGFEVEGTYWMMVGASYVEVYTYENAGKTAYGVTLSNNPSVFTWNETLGMLTTTVKVEKKDVELFLGNSGESTSIYAFPVAELAGETAYNTVVMTTDNTNGVALITNGLTVIKGYDASKHCNLHDLVNTKADCQVEGTLIQYCLDCGATLPTVITAVKDHTYDETLLPEPKCDKDQKVKLDCVYGCGEQKEYVVKAKGHVEKKDDKGEVIKEIHTGDHSKDNRLYYEYNVCKDCGAEMIIEGSMKVWPGAIAIFKDLDEAKANHPNSDLNPNPALSVAGSCTTVGYDAYTCSGCDIIVRVKADKTGEHQGKVEIAPTCTTDGGFVTYKCTKCGEKVGEGEVDKTFNKTADKLGHNMVENKDYVASTCENPNLDKKTNYAEICDRENCGYKVHDYELTENKKEQGNDVFLCTTVIYQEITCKIHGFHTINHVGGYGHEMIQDPNNKNVESSCTSVGYNYYVCKFGCGETKVDTVAKKDHKDEAGSFSEMCLKEARHCTVCCQCKNLEDHDCFNPDGDKKTNDACNCVKKAGEHDYKTQPTNSTCEQYPTKATICTLCHDSKDVVQVTKFNDAPIVLTHKPAAAELNENKEPIKHKGFEYKYITYVSYVWVGDVLTEKTESYWAVYTEYTEATLTTEGKVSFECQACKKTITETTDAINALQFSAEIVGTEFTYGSLVAVNVYANGANKELFGFNFNVNFSGMVFVGAEKAALNSTFIAETTPADEVNTSINVMGYVAGSPKNVTINEKTLLTTLYFRVVGDKISVQTAENENQDTASKYVVKDGKSDYPAVKAEFAKASEAKVAVLMDVDGNGKFNQNDIYVGIEILNMVVDYDYSVAGDVDYDGVFSIADLQKMISVLVASNQQNAKTAMVINAVGMEHAKLMGLVETCPTCKADYASYETHTCPKA